MLEFLKRIWLCLTTNPIYDERATAVRQPEYHLRDHEYEPFDLTLVPPPPPSTTDITDGFEEAAREIEEELREMHAVYHKALLDGIELAAGYRAKGAAAREFVQDQIRLASALTLNFRERREQLNAAMFSHAPAVEPTSTEG